MRQFEYEQMGIDGRVDAHSPNAARMYDYFLGGSTNFMSDREAAEQALEITPEIGRFARSNRLFLGRAVRFFRSRGIDQFLDLGSGIPTVGNVHEVAHHDGPIARVAYVDREPIAVAHARRLLGQQDHVTVTQADIRDPKSVLAAPGVAGLLDFTRPVAVLAVAILHFVPDADDPAATVAAYRNACVSGSYLAFSHASRITMTEQQVLSGQQVYRTTSTPLLPRSRDEIAAFLSGYTLLDPGLVPINHWPEATSEDAANGYAAVAALP